ncbi:NOGCT domain protein [Teladorsagia circumcincta]|uniref:NOGCT domain protein n=1 Tax=Teladorsagia circumcincta TaxID=45464 RepID=A0A2G9UL05_TELCI|nr:NOGCT domain protein [Teladorsagia circumcincta]
MLKNPEEKYDVIPEIWEGHNLADFVDVEIQKKLADLLAEEELREKAGEYDPDLDSDDEETKEKLELARQIREKEKLLTLENQINKKKAGNHVSRLNVRKRERSMSRLEEQMEELGVQIDTKRMKNLQGQAQKPQLGKKIKVGRSPSLSASRPPPRDELGIPDKTKRLKAEKLRAKALQHLKREARKGEADRHVYDLKPKHLFSGKRKMGKTDRR